MLNRLKDTRDTRSERLQQLDHELMTARTKDFDYFFAVRRGLRVRICVMRDVDDKFWATTQLGKRAYRTGGNTPSLAFWHLSTAIKVALASMKAIDREALRQEVSA